MSGIVPTSESTMGVTPGSVADGSSAVGVMSGRAGVLVLVPEIRFSKPGIILALNYPCTYQGVLL